MTTASGDKIARLGDGKAYNVINVVLHYVLDWRMNVLQVETNAKCGSWISKLVRSENKRDIIATVVAAVAVHPLQLQICI